MNATLYAGAGSVEVPPSRGALWVDGDLLCLQFPAVENIQVPGRPPLRIASHLVRFPADSNGVASVEMVLYLRQQMLKTGNESLLRAFAEVGGDLNAIMQLYKKILP